MFRFVIETFVILGCVYAIAIAAANVDNVLGYILSLVGATGSTTMCYILPGIFYLKMEPSRKWGPMKYFSVVMVCLGCIIMPTAIAFIIKKIINDAS